MTGVQTCALPIYIHTDEVHLRIELGKFHGIFTLAASQLQHDRVIIVEIHLTDVYKRQDIERKFRSISRMKI